MSTFSSPKGERYEMDNDNTGPKPKRQKLTDSVHSSMSPASQGVTTGNKPLQLATANHRPVTSCSHCRQHKIKCDANQSFPAPCSRCRKYQLHCEIDPQFKPQKGSQIHVMMKDIDDLKVKVESLLGNQVVLANSLKQSDAGQEILSKLQMLDPTSFRDSHKKMIIKNDPNDLESAKNIAPNEDQSTSTAERNSQSGKISVQTYLASEPNLLQTQRNLLQGASVGVRDSGNPASLPTLLNDSAPLNVSNEKLPVALKMALKTNYGPQPRAATREGTPLNLVEISNNEATLGHERVSPGPNTGKRPNIVTTTTTQPLPSPHEINLENIDEFVIGDVRIPIDQANELHSVFVRDYLPFLPIMFTNSATELYSQSQLLFWTVMLTACLSDSEPSLYVKLSSLIKQLAVETCWIRTPRSTHISQALLVLSMWPLPNQKVLDDCSYRFVNLAKSLSYQLGLHRGEFIWEFTRTQTSMPNAEKWRTRTWLGVYFAEICWASILGLPPTSQVDYLVETARSSEVETSEHNAAITESEETGVQPIKTKLPLRFKKMISLATYQLKLCNVMGSSVSSPDGLVEPKDRAGSLSILERELERLNKEQDYESDIAVHIYYLYVRLMVCCFAFLPGTPIEDQSHYVTEAYFCATKTVTLLNVLLETKSLISLPIYLRQSVSFAALILFKLQLNPLMINRYLNSTRQSIVTVHRLFRNQLTAWATGVENDISRTATMLEKLNMVLITHPEVFTEEVGIISRIRSHLTGSLFYDLVWCVHEARRRETDPNYKKVEGTDNDDETSQRNKIFPLPLYTHILREDFRTVTQTTPNGTTVTTLVPTENALEQSEESGKVHKNSDGTIAAINGIPLSMLDETGSVRFDNSLSNSDVSGFIDNTGGGVSTSKTKSNNGQPVWNSGPDFGNQPNIPGAKFSANAMKTQQNPEPIISPAVRRLGKSQSLFAPNTVANNRLVNRVGVSSSLSQPSPANNASNDVKNSAFNSLLGPMGTSFSNLNSLLGSKSHPSTPKASGSTITQNAKSKMDDDANHLNTFFQQQGLGWTEGNLNTDDLFGWFDNVNTQPEF
ncbi:Sef1p KNAG_0B02380 [Huiozyma naganishii CBS 8797]|uniref:Zn(2)-C6 fungal-type domain-containing protein n=1 Tax=Huiozyma naganishii (strain ATCC MYA-139 / BCRC 22969 / CBS 8797 / KCTC 17520 / NBRC 10181 / NCYC 3082 / Yp74L-3) TaxID=1071383 RepID=J7R1I7_HUIN7|nr:hypothetical protein KNAG_0B02380 [Kazachstania naganishii CBS 8797]CCK68680.1 hypothetical protein KNAG_0B02380 [Kazachstania naganishii CBS 8797]